MPCCVAVPAPPLTRSGCVTPANAAGLPSQAARWPSVDSEEERMSQLAPASIREGMRGLKGKNVLITGGSSGIGQAIAVRFAEHGANVAINYLTSEDEASGTRDQVQACANRVRQEGVRDVLVQGDVSSEDDVVRLVRQARDELGGLDVLINNAGIQI